jgi:hypothetical protein
MSSQCAPNHVLWLWVPDLRSRRAALHAAVARWSGTTAKYASAIATNWHDGHFAQGALCAICPSCKISFVVTRGGLAARSDNA